MEQIEKNIRLTQFSHGSGCGCKLSPEVLENLIKDDSISQNPHLLVGNNTNDDAAVYDIGDGRAIISTTDFFMPIVDDPYDFGIIAAVNSISDIYAMGGKPLVAVAILGWPVDKIDPKFAGIVLEGGRFACKQAGINLAGGHSIDNPEPVFGLAVTGIIDTQNLKRNSTAKTGSHLFITKPLGIGLISTAQKMGIAEQKDIDAATDVMKTLNSIGADLGKLEYVNAMTDVTGFGLLGHLIEICDNSNVSAEIDFKGIPKLPNLDFYLKNKTIPGGTLRNWKSFEKKVAPIDPDMISLLADPQTSGGLLISINENDLDHFEEFCTDKNIEYHPIGRIIERQKFSVSVH